MSKEILVKMQLPDFLDPDEPRSLIFSQWLPLAEDEALQIDYDNIRIRLWFDLSCVDSLEGQTEETIKNWLNVSVTRINVDVLVKDVADDLAIFIYEVRDWPWTGVPDISTYPGSKELSEEYKLLGQKILEATLRTVNRLLSFFRNYKQQYWIKEHPINFDRMGSCFIEYHAKAKIEGHEWARWYPPTTDHTVIMSASRDSAVTREEWEKVTDFVKSKRRPSLVLELLANAFLLIRDGHERSAIIEAVSALEVEISEFAAKPNYAAFLGDELTERIAEQSLVSQVESLGLRGTLRFLFPILLKPDVMPTGLLKDCREAVDIRNNVVHNGQRHVDNEKVWSLLRSIRKACNLLRMYHSN